MRHLPNILSVFRILLIPFILHAYLGASRLSDYILSGVLLAVSGITDMADGYIARKFNFITNVGKVLDPIADKLTQISVAAALWLRHPPLWPLPAFLLVKEAITAICGLWIYRKQGVVSQAKWYGKLATIIYYLVMFALITFPSFLESRFFWAPLSFVALAMTFSAVRYAVDFKRSISRKKQAEDMVKSGAGSPETYA